MVPDGTLSISRAFSSRKEEEGPRDPDKLRDILKEKQEEYEKAEDSEDIERLIPEIEMLKFVLYVYRQK